MDGEHVQDLQNISSQDNEMNGDTVTDGFDTTLQMRIDNRHYSYY